MVTPSTLVLQPPEGLQTQTVPTAAELHRPREDHNALHLCKQAWLDDCEGAGYTPTLADFGTGTGGLGEDRMKYTAPLHRSATCGATLREGAGAPTAPVPKRNSAISSVFGLESA